jgi:prepilin-type N-terminal cleavage/methylation domain-containing protein
MKTKGFTLIEVLVAGFILFLVISSAGIVFNGAVKSKQNATTSLISNAYVPILMEHISVQVKKRIGGSDVLQGQGHFLGVDYNWQATIVRRAPVKPQLSGEGGEQAGIIQGESSGEALLWQVELFTDVDRKQYDYAFSITSWVST